MPGFLAPEVSGAAQRRVRLPRSAATRQAITYCRLIERVRPDEVWGGWKFEGPEYRPGSVIPESELPATGLVLECAGAVAGGWGHLRAPVAYILWRYEGETGEFRELARTSSVARDWTQDLGPIAARELDPPRPFRIDPEAAARRLIQAINREIRPLEFAAQVLVIRAVEDRLAMGAAG